MNSTTMQLTDNVANQFTGHRRPVAESRPVTQNSAAEEKKEETSLATTAPEKNAKHAIRHADLKKAVEKINEKAKQVMREQKFTKDDNSNRVVIKVIDQNTKEVIREIPPEAVMHTAEQIDTLQGILLKEKA